MTSACALPDCCSSQKKPIKKTNSRRPSVSGAGKRETQPSVHNLDMEELEEYTFSLL